jgi:hypothetical protein
MKLSDQLEVQIMALHSKGRKHNKKRNVGLTYEFLVRQMIEGLLREDSSIADKALSIIRRRFKNGTHIYKEWRLMNAIVKTAGVNETVANAIIRETRDAVRKYDRVQLDKEKSLLIKELNHTFGYEFYDKVVPNYKLYATSQTLFDDWRCTGIPNISRIADYELKIHEHLMTKKNLELNEISDPETDAFVVRLMVEKLNKTYADKLSIDQRSILGRYSFEGQSQKLKSDLNEIKQDTMLSLEKYLSTVAKDDQYTRQKLIEARGNIEALNVDNVDDIMLAKFLKLFDLRRELNVE